MYAIRVSLSYIAIHGYTLHYYGLTMVNYNNVKINDFLAALYFL